MAEFLVIRLGPAGENCRAVALNSEGRVVQHTAKVALASLAPLTEQRRVIALIPGSEITTTETDLPPASPARLRQMLPYSLEDTFAEDIERLLFAPGRRLDCGSLAVSVIARECLDGWLELLERAGIKVDALYAETDGLPNIPSTLNFLLEGDCVYGRRPGHAAFVFEGLDLPQVMNLLRAQADDALDLQHVLIYADEAAQAKHAAGIDELRAQIASVDVKTYSESLLPYLAATLLATPGTNLLQGAYAPKSNWRALARPWYAAASLLAVAIAVALVAQAAEYFSLKRDDRLLTELLTTRCGAVVAANSLNNCRGAVQRQLSDAGAVSASAGETFLSTLSTVAEFRTDRSLIEALSYRNSIMDLQIVVPDVPALDAFAQQIVDTERFVARIQSANAGDSGVEGRIQVVGASN
jgi:general secretion pathway protein L